MTADVYYKKINNLLDEGQFGQALILTPFNYADGYAKGLELSAIYSEKNWGLFLNASTQKAQGRNINSGQALFGADELNYISNHYVYLDHDQKYTLSGGGHYHFGDSQVSADFLYGSGLRMTPDGGAPNSGHLPQLLHRQHGAHAHVEKYAGRQGGRTPGPDQPVRQIVSAARRFRRGRGGTAVRRPPQPLRGSVDKLLTVTREDSGREQRLPLSVAVRTQLSSH